jgi:hypothetical protein
VAVGGTKVVHDVNFFLVYPFPKLGILQESATTFGFAHFSCQEIASIFSFVDEVLHLKLVL